MTSYPRALPVGDSALTVEFGESFTPEANYRVRCLDHRLQEVPPRAFREAVPTLRSLLVLYDPKVELFGPFSEELLRLTGEATHSSGSLHEIPTLYGGEGGPDLGDLARQKRLSESELVRLHSSQEYTALMVGFTPGFAYLGPVDPRLEAPRRTSPRTRVPAGSVGLARGLTGIYPWASPGGWNLIGRTSAALFDPERAEPALIRPGDRVRFVPSRDGGPLPLRPPARTASGTIEIVEGGLLTTIQDLGRPGFRRVGVSGAGPMDPASHRAANRVLGNPESAPALEFTVQGPTLKFHGSVRFALTGAARGAHLLRSDLGSWPCPLGVPVRARPGNELSFMGASEGIRGYVAFEGGLEVPRVMGSASTDLVGGFGGFLGRSLRRGDQLSLGALRGERLDELILGETKTSVTVRVVLGPQDDHFEAESLAQFLGEPFSVTSECDRVGLRLAGTKLLCRGLAEIASDGMVPGSVEVPASGDPIVMMADAPTTGGYPKIATVVSGDLPLLAQLPPGGSIRFRAVSVEEAQLRSGGS